MLNIKLWLFFLRCGWSTLMIAELGETRGCSTNTFVIHSVSERSFPPTALQRRHAQTVRDCSFNYKIVIKTFLNPEGNQNPISGLKVITILLKGLILPIGEVHPEGSAPAACAAGCSWKTHKTTFWFCFSFLTSLEQRRSFNLGLSDQTFIKTKKKSLTYLYFIKTFSLHEQGVQHSNVFFKNPAYGRQRICRPVQIVAPPPRSF